MLIHCWLVLLPLIREGIGCVRLHKRELSAHHFILTHSLSFTLITDLSWQARNVVIWAPWGCIYLPFESRTPLPAKDGCDIAGNCRVFDIHLWRWRCLDAFLDRAISLRTCGAEWIYLIGLVLVDVVTCATVWAWRVSSLDRTKICIELVVAHLTLFLLLWMIRYFEAATRFFTLLTTLLITALGTFS